MTDPLSYLEYSDLPEPLQQVAHYLGMEVVREMLRHLPGEEISIPAPKRLPSLVRRFVAAEFNGENTRQLARSLRSSQTHIRKCLREEIER